MKKEEVSNVEVKNYIIAYYAIRIEFFSEVYNQLIELNKVI